MIGEASDFNLLGERLLLITIMILSGDEWRRNVKFSTTWAEVTKPPRGRIPKGLYDAPSRGFCVGTITNCMVQLMLGSELGNMVGGEIGKPARSRWVRFDPRSARGRILKNATWNL